MLISDYHMESTGQLTHERRVANFVKEVFVVRLRDLEQLNSAIVALDRAIGSFHAHLRYQGQPAGENALKELQANSVINAFKVKAK